MKCHRLDNNKASNCPRLFPAGRLKAGITTAAKHQVPLQVAGLRVTHVAIRTIVRGERQDGLHVQSRARSRSFSRTVMVHSVLLQQLLAGEIEIASFACVASDCHRQLGVWNGEKQEHWSTGSG